MKHSDSKGYKAWDVFWIKHVLLNHVPYGLQLHEKSIKTLWHERYKTLSDEGINNKY